MTLATSRGQTEVTPNTRKYPKSLKKPEEYLEENLLRRFNSIGDLKQTPQDHRLNPVYNKPLIGFIQSPSGCFVSVAVMDKSGKIHINSTILTSDQDADEFFFWIQSRCLGLIADIPSKKECFAPIDILQESLEAMEQQYRDGKVDGGYIWGHPFGDCCHNESVSKSPPPTCKIKREAEARFGKGCICHIEQDQDECQAVDYRCEWAGVCEVCGEPGITCYVLPRFPGLGRNFTCVNPKCVMGWDYHGEESPPGGYHIQEFSISG